MATPRLLCRKLAYAASLLVCLWLVSENSFNTSTALQQHEPSNRIFRGLLQINLLLWCTAISVYMYSKVVSLSLLEELLFQPPASSLNGRNLSSNYAGIVSRGECDLTLNNNENDEHDINNSNNKNNGFLDDETQSEFHHRPSHVAAANDDGLHAEDLDADDQSDGEVDGIEIHERHGVENVPTPASIASAAFDNLIIILICMFLYTLTSAGYTSDAYWKDFSQIAAPIFPILLFVYSILAAIFPRKKRGSFWIIMSYTICAPWAVVSFRDGFIGDILTSSVRPIQDVAFTFVYLLSGMRGWWSSGFQGAGALVENADDLLPAMEKSWIVHTIILPAWYV
jgi:hypothetical protein